MSRKRLDKSLHWTNSSASLLLAVDDLTSRLVFARDIKRQHECR